MDVRGLHQGMEPVCGQKGRGFQGDAARRPFGLGRKTLFKAVLLARGAKQPRMVTLPDVNAYFVNSLSFGGHGRPRAASGQDARMRAKRPGVPRGRGQAALWSGTENVIQGRGCWREGRSNPARKCFPKRLASPCFTSPHLQPAHISVSPKGGEAKPRIQCGPGRSPGPSGLCLCPCFRRSCSPAEANQDLAALFQAKISLGM